MKAQASAPFLLVLFALLLFTGNSEPAKGLAQQEGGGGGSGGFYASLGSGVACAYSVMKPVQFVALEASYVLLLYGLVLWGNPDFEARVVEAIVLTWFAFETYATNYALGLFHFCAPFWASLTA